MTKVRPFATDMVSSIACMELFETASCSAPSRLRAWEFHDARENACTVAVRVVDRTSADI